MKQPLSPSHNFLANLFLLLVIISVPLIALAETADQYLFQPQTYKRELIAERFYQRFPTLLAFQVAGQPDLLEGSGPMTVDPAQPGSSNSQQGLRLKYLGEPDYQLIFTELFPPDWVQQQSDSAIDQAFQYFNLVDPSFHMRISLIDVKQKLLGSQGLTIIHRVVQTWPPCDMNQAIDMLTLVLQGKLAGLPVCKPPDTMLTLFDPVYQLALQGMVQRLPDQIDLAAMLPGYQQVKSPQPLAQQNRLFSDQYMSPGLYPWFRLFVRYSPALLVFSMIGLTLAAVNNWVGFLGWWGSGLAIGGGLTLIAGLVGRPLVNDELVSLFGTSAPAFGSFFEQFARNIISRYFFWISIEAGVVLMIGAFLLLLRFLIRRR